ncbi:MAG: adenylate/guanylate cyclase domain-containing protein [Alphaproteobacteria bacterium]|nr:adenylate/guanylate cyclase domain-containing protein [Alphaproteobacteria bacterium]
MIRRLRLASGLVMLSYVTMHLLNHAAGLISLGAMEQTLHGVMALWTQWPMQTLLYGSFGVHYALALWALWERRSLRLNAAEWTQLALGFLIPVLLVRHVVNLRLATDWFGTEVNNYVYILWVYAVRSPRNGVLQITVLIVAWAHAMIGLHFWLRVRPWYARMRELGLTIAVIVPVLALLGVFEAGRRVVALAAADPNWAERTFAGMALPSPQAAASLERIIDGLTWLFVALPFAVLLARAIRYFWERRRGLVRVSYPDGRTIEVLRGTSVLEASRLAKIPHASVCGGRGRCSTCRVRVRAALPGLPPPSEEEGRVLDRIGARRNVRLACQLRPTVPVEVTPLLPPFAHAADGLRRVDLSEGGERELAVLFADIRGFTALAEGRLPYDIVFILNRYFDAMGRAVEEAGGRLDKFLGDGVMALFGIEGEPDAGCRDALTAARLMSLRLRDLNEALRGELAEPLRIGIGIHAGPAIVGEMGYGAAAALTAIGDAVNTASRLEALTKEYQCELIVSDEVILRAGVDRSLLQWRQTEIRGKQERLAIAILASAQDLPAGGLAERPGAVLTPAAASLRSPT